MCCETLTPGNRTAARLLCGSTGDSDSRTLRSQVDGSTVSWTALDYGVDPPARRTLRATLDTPASAAELARVMTEGVEIAAGSGIGDTEETAGAAASGGG